MSYKVSAMDWSDLCLNEQDTVKSVLQNIALILSTPKGSIPLYRSFGLPTDFRDKPLPIAKSMMVAHVRETVEEWEPRATVIGVTFTENVSQPGVLIPTVEVEINE